MCVCVCVFCDVEQVSLNTSSVLLKIQKLNSLSLLLFSKIIKTDSIYRSDYTRSESYKPFYGINLRIFVIS